MGSAVLVLAMMAAQASTAAPVPDGAPDKARPTTVASDSPVSVERIYEGLQRPALKIPQIEYVPVFRATVDEILVENPLQGLRRELAAESGYPGKKVDIIAAVMSIVRGIKGAYRAYSEARIRKEVQEALTAFCAEHDCSILEDGPPPMEGIVLPGRARPQQ